MFSLPGAVTLDAGVAFHKRSLPATCAAQPMSDRGALVYLAAQVGALIGCPRAVGVSGAR